jgi:peptidoglycan/LPS O-acetylase OafA/YrhL
MMAGAASINLWLEKLARRVYELPATSGRFEAMEGLRAYAALLVFMVHYLDAYGNQVLHVDFNTFRFGQSEDAGINVLYYLFASHYGVDIFFLLSGFLIAKIVARSGFNYRSFLWHRVRRIYPAFFISLLIWTYLRVVVQDAYAFDPAQFIGNMLFLNALPELGVKAYAVMTWSLFYEFAFYLSFPILVAAAKNNRTLRPTTLVSKTIALSGQQHSSCCPPCLS